MVVDSARAPEAELAVDRRGDADQGRSSRPRWGSILLVGLLVSGLFAAVSMFLTVLAVRIFTDGHPSSTKTAVMVAGTMVGTCAGSWFGQSFLAQAGVGAAARSRRKPKP
jgi:hypothetical protein